MFRESGACCGGESVAKSDKACCGLWGVGMKVPIWAIQCVGIFDVVHVIRNSLNVVIRCSEVMSRVDGCTVPRDSKNMYKKRGRGAQGPNISNHLQILGDLRRPISAFVPS